MKLQVALDYFTIKEALDLMDVIHPFVSIVELGSPLMYAEGFLAIKKMKEVYPEKIILADMKIVDGGYDIGKKAYEAGADIVTSIALTNDETLKGLVRAACEMKKEAMVDVIGVEDVLTRVREMDEMGFDYILLHTAHDTLASDVTAPIRDLEKTKAIVHHAKIGISGGISSEQMNEISVAKPDWVVVGSAITLSKDPLAEVKRIVSF